MSTGTTSTRPLRRRRTSDPGLRLRVERLLRAAELEPDGFPAAAILVVRAVADPLPATLAPRAGDTRAPPRWERAVRDALADRWRRAARPAREPVPPGAEAVLFADGSEMIAAFAHDAVEGGLSRWWWRSIVRGLPEGALAATTALWTREARHVPAAVELLAAQGAVGPVLGALSAAQAARILTAVALAFDAPALLSAPPAAAPLPRSAPPARTGEARGLESDRSGPGAAPAADPRHASSGAGRVAGLVPPWSGLLPPDAVPGKLPVPHAALAGVALVLHRAPLLGRGAAFAARFSAWMAGASATPAPALSPRGAGERGEVALDEPAAPAAPATAPSPPALDPARPATADAPPDAAAPRAAPALPPTAARGRPPVHPDRVGVPEAAAPAGPAPHGAEPWAPADAGGIAPWSVAILSPPIEVARTPSGACGVFYLVNALRSLGFYDALETHFRLEPHVGGWGWIELVARALLGPRAGGLAGDAVWGVLAALDGREHGEPPGAGFVAPAHASLPERWIELFGGARPPPAPVELLGTTPHAELADFLARVVPLIRARVEGALRAAGAEPGEPLETALLRRTGLLEATPTHLDVRMPMDQVTLPVRLAGLDANPGWVPALGRVVAFHYEEASP